ncbi:hypothetical protein ACFX13_007195 [Malus domestica]
MAMVQITCDPFKRQKLLLVVVEISAMVVGMRDMLSQHSSSSTSMTLTDSYKNFLKYIYLLPIPSFREYRGCSLSNQIKMAELKHHYYIELSTHEPQLDI